MTKVVQCRDLGFDCAAVARGDTEEAVLREVAAHAKAAHGMDQVPPAVVDRVRKVMRTERADG